MILVPFLEISNGYRVAKNVRKLRVQVIPRSIANAFDFSDLSIFRTSYMQTCPAARTESLFSLVKIWTVFTKTVSDSKQHNPLNFRIVTLLVSL